MSLILKSNSIANKSLGNINGLSDQNFVFFADFSRRKYTLKSSGEVLDIAENDALNAANSTRVASSLTMKRNGGIEEIGTTKKPRFWLSENKRYGLLIESDDRNYFANANAPASQTINALPAGHIVFSVIGTGSLIVTTDSGVFNVTESAPQVIRTTVATQFDVVVNGHLSYAQVVRQSGQLTARSPISSAANSGYDSIKLSDAILNAINKSLPVTVLMQIEHMTLPDVVSGTVERKLGIIATLLTSNAIMNLRSSLEVDTKRTATYSQILQSSDLSLLSTLNTTNAELLKKNIIGSIADDFTIADNAFDEVKTFASSPGEIVEITLGAPSLLSHANNTDLANCIITKLAIFNKDLSSEDLISLLESWQ